MSQQINQQYYLGLEHILQHLLCISSNSCKALHSALELNLLPVSKVALWAMGILPNFIPNTTEIIEQYTVNLYIRN
jgi:hypothetical protein